MKRPTRPTRARLEAVIVEQGGNMSKVALALGVTRPTLYTWTYQLGLGERAGIREAPLPGATPDRTTATVQLPAELWRWVRVEAIKLDVTASALVEEAIECYRAIRAAAAAGSTGGAR